jgi:hypothetical protein
MVAMPSRIVQRRLSWLLGVWVAAITLLLLQRPLEAPGLWWHLARGREVVKGTFSPSRQLLVFDRSKEADWLGGVPFYLGWKVAGIHGLAAVPLLAGLTLLVFIGRRISRDKRQLAAILLLPPALWVVRDGLQPVPQLLDLVGMASLWRVFNADWSKRNRLLAIFAVFCVWANLGPRPVWGLAFLVLYCPPGRLNFRMLAAALLGGMLTPRGLFTWKDSAILFAPSVFAHVEAFDANWRSLMMDPRWSATEIAFFVLWGTWVVHGLFHRPDLNRVLRWIVALSAALLCRGNLPLCGLWILLDTLTLSARTAASTTRNAMPPSQSGRPTLTSPTVARPTWPFLKRVGVFSAAVVMSCLVLIDAAGQGLPPYVRLGWGISHELDHRLLDAGRLGFRERRLRGWAADSRSVGIVSWLWGAGSMVDHPQRALLAGRGRMHAALIDDLMGAHRARYRRDDGSWGGWLRTLADWKVDVLFLPMRATRLHRALVETEWRPADLDSPTVPYVFAEDPRFARVIFEVMRQQDFVETGPWQPAPLARDGHGWRYDAVDLVGLGPSPEPAIRQSRLFRSMRIPLASLRVLLPIRRRTRHRHLREEFRACQNELAHQEWVKFGNASRFRRLVEDALAADRNAAHPRAQEIATDSSSWNAAVELYLSGRLIEAIEVLPRHTPQQRYAAAMLWLELGDTGHARAEFKRVSPKRGGTVPAIAAAYWLRQSESFQASTDKGLQH